MIDDIYILSYYAIKMWSSIFGSNVDTLNMFCFAVINS